ncbi:MAG TPA: MarR family transcriptional regulator [Pyrinomonadaceae bacterium]|jgi:DNA-binding MarR family transcriptional regulator
MAATTARAEEVLSSFAEAMGRLLVEQHRKHLAELDLTLLQAQVMRVLRRDGPILPGKLAVELGISAPAMTQLTDRLVRKHLIERRAGTADRRSVQVALSARGKRLVDQFRRRRSDIFEGALKTMSEADRAQVVRALEKVNAALAAYEQAMTAGPEKCSSQ